MKYQTEYRRKLPHIQPENGVFFITFRLIDSLPRSIVEKLNQDYKQEILNYKNGPHWLNNKKAANIINDSILFCKEILFTKNRVELQTNFPMNVWNYISIQSGGFLDFGLRP